MGHDLGSHKDISPENTYMQVLSKILSPPRIWFYCLAPSMPSSTVLLPDSPAYKKAQRQYLKATKNRPANISGEWTPFRAAEKRFKARFPPPDLSSVLDIACADDQRAREIDDGRWIGSSTAFQTVGLECTSGSRESAKAYTIPQIPGALKSSNLPTGIPERAIN